MLLQNTGAKCLLLKKTFYLISESAGNLRETVGPEDQNEGLCEACGAYF